MTTAEQGAEGVLVVIGTLIIFIILIFILSAWFEKTDKYKKLKRKYIKETFKNMQSVYFRTNVHEIIYDAEMVKLKIKLNNNIDGFLEFLKDEGFGEKELIIWLDRYKLDMTKEKLDKL